MSQKSYIKDSASFVLAFLIKYIAVLILCVVFLVIFYHVYSYQYPMSEGDVYESMFYILFALPVFSLIPAAIFVFFEILFQKRVNLKIVYPFMITGLS